MTAVETLVRRLTPEDATAYRTLRLDGLRAEPDYFGSTYVEEACLPLTDFEKVMSVDENPEFFNGAFGGFVDGALTGVVGFYRLTPAAERLRHKGVLCALYVRCDARGTGLATSLVDAVCAFAFHKVELLQLSVMIDNLRARRFYEKCGFETYGVEPKAMKLADSYVDLALMWRPITG